MSLSSETSPCPFKETQLHSPIMETERINATNANAKRATGQCEDRAESGYDFERLKTKLNQKKEQLRVAQDQSRRNAKHAQTRKVLSAAPTKNRTLQGLLGRLFKAGAVKPDVKNLDDEDTEPYNCFFNDVDGMELNDDNGESTGLEEPEIENAEDVTDSDIDLLEDTLE
ncbi:hypothetical protein B0H16DRAFT_1740930 [Mycena metata]|uniref:Uncharacterized protein n=1 Tax=Mycena metata TaxID=1033252 RepID=A0AAD7MH97_9AGAR|nr:hypothetical protein B0H16DRAFT_1740930 [Mycena metata]